MSAVNSLGEQTDDYLVELARKGDDQAFGELITRHHLRCVNLAASILKDRSEAEDEAQNAYLNAFRHLDQLRGGTEFKTWLSRIVIRQCLMLIRDRRGVRFLRLDAGVLDLQCARLDPEREAGDRQLRGILKREIRRMPVLYRDVLILHDVHELHIEEVAYRLGIRIKAAASRLHRARVLLRERILRYRDKRGRL